jgi:SAM-dependent methyltransferase
VRISPRKAKLYGDHRLPYAEGTGEAIRRATGLRPEAKVVELGSGTGLLTAQLVSVFDRVFAVEPEAALRERAKADLADRPAFTSIGGTAQETGLPPVSCDLAAAGNALHRLPVEETLRELARVLRPPRWLVSVGYDFRCPSLDAALERREDALRPWRERMRAAHTVTDARTFFEPSSVETTRIEADHAEGIEPFVGAALAALEAPEPGDADFEAYVAAHREAFEEAAPDGVLRLRYDTVVTVGRLRGL